MDPDFRKTPDRLMRMDKVLKQRLIGATILIALAVIFLPMLLVGPDDDMPSDSVDFDVPPVPEQAREVRRIPLDPEAARVRQPESSEASADTADLTAGNETGEMPDITRPLGEPPGQSPPQTQQPAEQPDEIVLRPEVRTEPESPTEPAADSSQPTDEAETATAPPTTEVEASSPGGSWVVQVASFGSNESAARVRQRLEALGHQVIEDSITLGGNDLIRLKTGPYATRAAAGRARAQITATVEGVAPLVRSSDLPAAAATPDQSGFAVQVGSFASQANAERETERLRGLGFDAFRFSEDAAGREIWRVRVGPLGTRSAAASLQTRLRDEAGVEGLIVSHP